MGVVLPVGENVSVPPANTKELILDTAGDPKLLLPDGTTEDVSGAGFGSDVTVPLPNSIAVDVTALQLTTSLTTNTAGAEVSKWVVKLLNAGAQVTALDLRPGVAAGNPAGAPGSLTIPLSNRAEAWMRLVFTRSAGSGTMSCSFGGKGI